MALVLRTLIVEDNDDDAELLLRSLRRGGFDPVYERVQTAEAMRAALEQAWDVVISDWGMPHFSAMHALSVLHESQHDTPFLIVSGTIGEEAAVSAMRAGAHDFIAKGRLSRLIPAIEREMREAAGRAERRRIEQQLQRSQRMEAMGQLTGGIAHDFNNLLGVIVANGDMLLEMVQDDPEKTELTNEILSSALHGAELTRRLLAFARQQPLSAQRIELNARLSPMVGLLKRTLGEGIDIDAKLADDLWATRADTSQVENAVLNLSINARDAMPNGGRLTIETANVHLDDHYAELHPEVVAGDYVLLSITDTGTGMSPETVERAIEPFFTTKGPGKGTGLGLSMVYGFAKQSGGHFSIYSELGVGTTMRLYLPRDAEVAKEEVVVSAAAKALPTGREAILLVDDNTALRRATGRRLRALGYGVVDAENAHEALAILDRGEQFHLLFTDIGLPGGMNGLQLAELARQKLPTVKVLLTSGYAGPTDEAARITDPLLRKPYTSEELATTLRTVLGLDN